MLNCNCVHHSYIRVLTYSTLFLDSLAFNIGRSEVTCRASIKKNIIYSFYNKYGTLKYLWLSHPVGLSLHKYNFTEYSNIVLLNIYLFITYIKRYFTFFRANVQFYYKRLVGATHDYIKAYITPKNTTIPSPSKDFGLSVARLCMYIVNKTHKIFRSRKTLLNIETYYRFTT